MMGKYRQKAGCKGCEPCLQGRRCDYNRAENRGRMAPENVLKGRLGRRDGRLDGADARTDEPNINVEPNVEAHTVIEPGVDSESEGEGNEEEAEATPSATARGLRTLGVVDRGVKRRGRVQTNTLCVLMTL